MFFRNFLLSVAISLTFLGCDITENECAAVLCAGPPALAFEVLANGENVIENQTYTLDDITLEGTDASDFVLSTVLYRDNNSEIIPVLVLENPQWSPQAYNLTLTFGSETTTALQIVIDQSEMSGCCGGIPFLENLRVNESEPQRDNDTGLFILNLN